MKRIALILILGFAGFYDVPTVFGQRHVLFSFCQFQLTDQQMQANLTFTQNYAFKLDREGKASSVKRILGRDAWVTDDKAIACFEQWTFKGFDEGQRFTVYFSWVHAEGWTRMSIRSKDFSQVVVNCPESCPKDYATMIYD